MLDKTVLLNDPKFIRCESWGYYCFGNCKLCRIRFQCWTGVLEGYADDTNIEMRAFGNILGRIIVQCVVHNGKFSRIPYPNYRTSVIDCGDRKILDTPVFRNSSLLYINDKNMVCCKKKGRPVHRVKGFGGT